MKKYDILLTDTENETAYENAYLYAHNQGKRQYFCEVMGIEGERKAQCRKLIALLNERCQTHFPDREFIDDCPKRIDCHKCIEEINKILTENNVHQDIFNKVLDSEV